MQVKNPTEFARFDRQRRHYQVGPVGQQIYHVIQVKILRLGQVRL